jgi:hypothetical protein
MNPLTWTKAQWDAAGRHVLTLIGTAAPILIMLKVVSPEQIGTWTVWGTNLFAAVGALCLALAPIYAALRAAQTASPSNQIDQVAKNLAGSAQSQTDNALADPESRDKIIEAVANMPEVKNVKMKDPAVAEIIPSQKVI